MQGMLPRLKTVTRNAMLISLGIAGIYFIYDGARVADFKGGLTAYNAGDYATAYALLDRLADRGDAKAQHLLAHMYILGKGVGQNRELAVAYFRKAAINGYAQNDELDYPHLDGELRERHGSNEEMFGNLPPTQVVSILILPEHRQYIA